MPRNSRLRGVQSLLRSQNVPTFLVTSPINIRYLTGADVSEGMLLVTPRTATLFVDGRYREAVGAVAAPECRVQDRSAFGRALARLQRCAYEEDHVTAGRLRRWKRAYKNTKFVHTSGLVEGLRRKKDSAERATIQRALTITNDVLVLVPAMLHPGMTEQELAGQILLATLARGAEGMAFDTIVAFGSNTSRPHHRPGSRKLRARDIVQIDMGARVEGYAADRSEVYFVGTPPRAMQRVYTVVEEAKAAAMSLVKVGVSCRMLDEAARTVLRAAGMEALFPHALGHGLGLEIHEGVTIGSRSEQVLQAGEVVTIEPGVYRPGAFGVRLEETIIVR